MTPEKSGSQSSVHGTPSMIGSQQGPVSDVAVPDVSPVVATAVVVVDIPVVFELPELPELLDEPVLPEPAVVDEFVAGVVVASVVGSLVSAPVALLPAVDPSLENPQATFATRRRVSCTRTCHSMRRG
ncbi:MAG: hypothetical protein KC468_30215 [Myxococcales bacterium]|nr:hypothetical protein [Myxococcales bacterium]